MTGPTGGISRGYHRARPVVRYWKCPKRRCGCKDSTYSSSRRAPACPVHQVPMKQVH